MPVLICTPSRASNPTFSQTSNLASNPISIHNLLLLSGSEQFDDSKGSVTAPSVDSSKFQPIASGSHPFQPQTSAEVHAGDDGSVALQTMDLQASASRVQIRDAVSVRIRSDLIGTKVPSWRVKIETEGADSEDGSVLCWLSWACDAAGRGGEGWKKGVGRGVRLAARVGRT